MALEQLVDAVAVQPPVARQRRPTRRKQPSRVSSSPCSACVASCFCFSRDCDCASCRAIAICRATCPANASATCPSSSAFATCRGRVPPICPWTIVCDGKSPVILNHCVFDVDALWATSPCDSRDGCLEMGNVCCLADDDWRRSEWMARRSEETVAPAIWSLT